MLPDNPLSIDFLRDIIIHELLLGDDRVNIYNQKFNIPPDKHLFVGIEYKFSKVFASKNEALTYGTAYLETQGLNTQEHLAVLMFSRSIEALQRKEEAVMALNSVYARQMSDRYAFKIGRIAPIQDLSSLEGAAILYRFEIPVVMLCRYYKTRSIDWYGTFPGRVTIEDGKDETVEFTPVQPT
jgi:hypothetical protein